MRRALCISIAAMLASSCGGASDPAPPDPSPTTSSPRPSEPYAYVTPTPPNEPTNLDGSYARQIRADMAGGSGACRRCPPYRMEESAQTLRFDRGVFSIENDAAAEKSIDWRSVGHYTVEGDTVRLFNDPNCPTVDGLYRWRLAERALTLELVSDECAFGGLRWRYLTASPWTSV